MSFRLAWMVGLLAVVACGDDDRGTGPRVDAGPSGVDAGRLDAGTAMECSGDGDCDDGHECTVDMCAVGGVCRHTGLNERCGDGEICTLESGCSDGCVDDDDCQDGLFCNGSERCIAGGCFMGTANDCDDGNECTIDTCDDSISGCRYETAAGCDAGVPPGSDAGTAAPFDPELHYTGTFVVAPVPDLGCGASSYNVSSVTFSTTAELRIQADRFLLTQGAVPDGPTFATRTSDGTCSDVRLEGTFSDANTFSGRWSTACGLCMSVSLDITGFRAE